MNSWKNRIRMNRAKEMYVDMVEIRERWMLEQVEAGNIVRRGEKWLGGELALAYIYDVNKRYRLTLTPEALPENDPIWEAAHRVAAKLNGESP